MTSRVEDSNGWMEIKDNPISKVGVFQYRGAMVDPNGELGLDPEGVYNVFRPAEELSNPETIESFKLIPWIDGHEILGGESPHLTPAEQKGVDGVIGEDVYFRDGYLFGNIKLFSEELAGKVDDGRSELSCGYRCNYELKDGVFGDQNYSVVQTNIRGNHLASVDEGRMGPEVAVLDQQLSFTIDSKDFKQMAKKTLKEILATDGADASPLMLAVVESLATLTTGMDALMAAAADEDDDEKKGEDEDDEKKGEDMGDPDKEMSEDMGDPDKEMSEDAGDPDKEMSEDADEDEDEEKSSGMDALDTRLRKLEIRQKRGTKRVMREIRNRDALYEKVSPHIGAFDHQDMTSDELASYACGKLGIKAPKHNAVIALDAYFVNRAPVRAFAGDGALSRPGTAKAGSAVANYLKSGAAK